MNEKLEHRLRRAVDEELETFQQPDALDEEYRVSAVNILNIVDVFLREWQGQETSSYDDDDFPADYLRKTLSTIVREIGPGDNLLQKAWFRTLRFTCKPTVVGRFVLDFLPCTILRNPEETTRTVLLDIFKRVVVEKDQTSVPQVLDCLSMLRNTGRLAKKEVLGCCITMMPRIVERFLPRAVRCLLENISDEVDTKEVVATIRNEVSALEATGDNNTAGHIMSVAMVLHEVYEKNSNDRFFEVYIAEILDNSTSERDIRDHEEDGESQSSLDVLILIMQRGSAKYGGEVRRLLDEMVARHAILPEHLDCLIKMAMLKPTPEQGQALSLSFEALLGPCTGIVWLLVSLLLFPLRRSRNDPEAALVSAETLGKGLMNIGNQKVCDAIAQALMELNKELLAADGGKRSQPEHPEMIASSHEARNNKVQNVSSTVYALMSDAASVAPASFQPHITTLATVLRTGDLNQQSIWSICQIFALVDKYTITSRNRRLLVGSQDPFLFTRSLLFSQVCGPDGKQLDSLERRMRGLTLTSALLSSGHLKTSSVRTLWGSVRMILLPPTNRLPHPRVGIHALIAARSFHLSSLCQESDTISFRNNIFETMTSVMTMSRLVQYTDAIKEHSRDGGRTLGYTIRPKCFEYAIKKTKLRKMRFSFAYLYSNSHISRSQNWKEAVQFVFDLVDIYLSLGRSASKGKWVPHTWVEASFQFPSVGLSGVKVLSARQQRAIDIVEGAILDFQICDESSHSTRSIDREFGEVVKQLSKSHERSDIARSLLCCAFSYSLALAMTGAILRNTYARYTDVLDDQTNDHFRQKKVEATRLLQYQLYKVYDLIGKCQIMEKVFRSINSTSQPKKQKRKKRSRSIPGNFFADKEILVEIQHAPGELKSMLAAFIHDGDHIDFQVLWYCLADPIHDTIIINEIGRETSCRPLESRPVSEDIETILDLRLSILKHLNQQLGRFIVQQRDMPLPSLPNSLKKELQRIKPYFAQSLRLAAYISMSLPQLDENQSSEKLSRLAAAYFRVLLLAVILILKVQWEDTISPSNEAEILDLLSYTELVGLYRSILGAEEPLVETIVVANGGNAVSFNLLLSSFLRHLRICKDAAITTELLETLSVFSLDSNSDDSISEMVGITWAALHSRYNIYESPLDAIVPNCFLEAVKRLAPGALKVSSLRSKSEVCIRETILKVALSKSKNMEKHTFLVHGLLRHFGTLALTEGASTLLADHLHELFSNLKSFLRDINEPTTPRARKRHHEVTLDEDDEYLPPKRKSREPKPVIPESVVPGLDAKSFPTYFQVLLDMAVAASALFKVRIGVESVGPHDGPFEELCNIMETFGLLIDLYRKRIHIFSQHFLSSVLNTSRSMLNVVSYQTEECIEWRSSQPTRNNVEMQNGVADPASVRFLHTAFDAMGMYVLGKLSSLCETIEVFTSSTEQMNDQELFGPGQKQKSKALRLKINRVTSELDRHATAHNLPPPKMDTGPEGGDDRLVTKRRRIEVKGFLEFEESTEESEEMTTVVRAVDVIVREADPILHRDEGRELTSDLTSEGSVMSESSEESFFGEGNWWRESDDEEELGVSELQLRV